MTELALAATFLCGFAVIPNSAAMADNTRLAYAPAPDRAPDAGDWCLPTIFAFHGAKGKELMIDELLNRCFRKYRKYREFYTGRGRIGKVGHGGRVFDMSY